jgi:hypothetical protein
LNSLTNKKQTIEVAIKTDRILLEQTLAKALIVLKQQKPEIFYMTGAEQTALIVGLIIKGFLK